MDETEEFISPEDSEPDMIEEINGVTYVVRAHFKEDVGETMEQKIKRMIRNEVIGMSLIG